MAHANQQKLLIMSFESHVPENPKIVEFPKRNHSTDYSGNSAKKIKRNGDFRGKGFLKIFA